MVGAGMVGAGTPGGGPHSLTYFWYSAGVIILPVTGLRLGFLWNFWQLGDFGPLCI
jgi:hypothetical protein